MSARRITLIATAAALTAGAVGLAAPASASATPSSTAPSSTAPSSTAAACDKAPWEAAVQGRPAAFKAGSPSGDYLWHDRRGFHLRVTHGTNHDRRIYTGVITSSAPMRVERVRLEKGDRVHLSANHRRLSFAFANRGYIDGVNFHTYCASTLTVAGLHVGAYRLGAEHAYLGAHRAHPARVPFTVHRVTT